MARKKNPEGGPLLLKPRDVEARYGLPRHVVYGWSVGRGEPDRPRVVKMDGGLFVHRGDLEEYIGKRLSEKEGEGRP
ncbi:MAG: hypothetical protein AABZ64_16485 [Nitrospinota bacterium]